MTTLPIRRRLPSRGVSREILVFGAIGIASTAAYGVLYLALRGAIGSVAANALALILTAIANTAANRRLTFGVRDRDRGPTSMLRDQVGGFLALAVALAITTATASLLAALAPNAGRLVELAALTAANAASTVARFVLLRSWISSSAQGVAS
jgi:putative flippase GtrA